MIRVAHNGIEKAFEDLTAENLGDVIVSCLGDDGSRVLRSVSVNGCAIPDNDLEGLRGFSLEGIDRIEIVTCEARIVALESLDSCLDYAAELERALLTTAAYLRSGKIVEANELFANIADAISVFLFAISVSDSALGGGDEELHGMEEELQPWLDELIDAQSERDWVRIADYAEFELAELVAEWRRRIQRVQRRYQVQED